MQTREGELAFPNAKLEVLSGRARVDRESDQPLRVRIVEAEAVGRAGDYQIVLNPSGQVYPAACYDPECIPLDLGIRTVPYLDPAYALALLVGPVVAPTMGAGLDTLSVLKATRRPMPTTGALTGFLLPGLGTPNVSLQFSFEGPLSLRLQERLFGKVYVQYVSPLTGPAETRRVGITYQATPRYSIGFSTDALNNTRYQAQYYWTF
jgi:hypothetical protein